MRRLTFFFGVLFVSVPSRGTAQSPDSDREWQLPNEALYLDVKMRDFEAEKAYHLSKEKGTPYNGPKVEFVGKNRMPIVPLQLKMTDQEKKDLMLFLRSLEGDAVDPVVADRSR